MAPTESHPPQDPATLTSPIAPAFPLTQNGLQDIMEYKATAHTQNSVVSRVALPRGSHLCYITTHTPTPKATWSSIQTGKYDHVELNNALLYMNHSCEPTVELEVHSPDSNTGRYPEGISGEVRVSAARDLEVGDSLTFFYPSTEWITAKAFKCLCGAGKDVCIGEHLGSRELSKTVLDRYFVNRHVHELAAERDGQ